MEEIEVTTAAKGSIELLNICGVGTIAAIAAFAATPLRLEIYIQNLLQVTNTSDEGWTVSWKHGNDDKVSTYNLTVFQIFYLTVGKF